MPDRRNFAVPTENPFDTAKRRRPFVANPPGDLKRRLPIIRGRNGIKELKRELPAISGLDGIKHPRTTPLTDSEMPTDSEIPEDSVWEETSFADVVAKEATRQRTEPLHSRFLVSTPGLREAKRLRMRQSPASRRLLGRRTRLDSTPETLEDLLVNSRGEMFCVFKLMC